MKKIGWLICALSLWGVMAQAEGTMKSKQTTTMKKSEGISAMNQGKTAADTELTRRIREDIVADSSLSMRSKNVTIISQDGEVTLKGKVPNTTEQMRIEEIAKKAAGPEHVINKTEISVSN